MAADLVNPEVNDGVQQGEPYSQEGSASTRLEAFFRQPPEVLRENPRLVIFIDMDGVLGHKFRPETKGLTELQRLQLEHVGQVVERLKGERIVCVLCTGRQADSLTCEDSKGRSILSLTGIETAFCEHTGVLVFKRPPDSLKKGEPEEEMEKIVTISQEKIDLLEELKSSFETGYELMPKDTMLTIQIPEEKRRSPEDRQTFRQAVEAEIGREAMTRFKDLGGQILVSHGSVDICFTSKEGVAGLAQGLGIDRSRRMAVGDSGSDRAMMAVCAFAACPANASEGLKNYVMNREEGGLVTAQGMNEATGLLKILTLVLKASRRAAEADGQFLTVLTGLFEQVQEGQESVKGRGVFERKYDDSLRKAGIIQ